MVKVDADNLYQCEGCGFHYKEEDVAKECEAWCKTNHTCNILITASAVENKENAR